MPDTSVSLYDALHEPIVLAHIAALLAAMLATYVACYPVVAFVRRGWAIKRGEVVSSLSANAKKLYLQVCLNKQPTDPEAEFNAIYDSRYGRYRLIVPSALLALVLLPLTFLVCERGMAALATANEWALPPKGIPKLLNVPDTAVAAIVGAYTWIVASLISAAASHNLPPGVVLGSVLRLVAAVPMGYAVASLATAGVAPFVAFAIGAFPLSAVQSMLQKLGAKQLSVDTASADRRDQVMQLSGTDPAIADRLREADITTVPQLAYCDPVQISMRTNLAFPFILDLAGQALTWIYFEQKLDGLRMLGLRGAYEVRSLYESLAADDAQTRAGAEATFNAAAKVLGAEPPAAYRGVFEEIANDPYTDFIWKVWNEEGAASAPTVAAAEPAMPRSVAARYRY